MNRNDFSRQDAVSRTVHKVLRSRINDHQEIEDIAQSVQIVCLKYERDNASPPPQRFIVTVARHMYCSWVRKQNRRRKILLLPSGYEAGSSKEDPAIKAEKADLSSVCVSLLNGLPPRYREIVWLRIVEEWTYEHIARDRGIPISTVKTQFRRGLALLEEAGKRYSAN
jgi:RNA polymerase sigma factor (sigma-70 family)